MHADQWIETILNPNVATGYALAVTDQGEEVYTRLAADRDYLLASGECSSCGAR